MQAFEDHQQLRKCAHQLGHASDASGRQPMLKSRAVELHGANVKTELPTQQPQQPQTCILNTSIPNQIATSGSPTLDMSQLLSEATVKVFSVVPEDAQLA